MTDLWEIQKTHAQTQLNTERQWTRGNRTPNRPRPTVLQLLSGTRTGERNLPNKVIKIKIGFSKKNSKISTSEQEAQEAQAEFVYAQTKFVFANFPQKCSRFFGKLASGNCARAHALCKARSQF